MPMRRLVLIVPFLAMGCDVLAPAYDPDADRRMLGAYQEISGILAQADLGALSKPSSYPAEIPTYASIISQLETAKLSLGGASAKPGSAAARSQDALISVVNGCITEVKSLAGFHQASGIIPNAGITTPVRVACDAAVKAAQARRT